MTPRKPHRTVDGVETKHCPVCDNWLPLAAYHAAASAWDKKQGLCADCKKARRKKAPRSYIIARYGLTEDQYDALLTTQGYSCAICGTDAPGGRGAWHIDHDHDCCAGPFSCGKCVRGLLCGLCNAGLGYFKDDTSRLSSAIQYLEEGVTSEF